MSVIEISKNKFDAGAILYQEKVAIDEGTRFSELSVELAEMGGIGVLEVLKDLDGHRARKVMQDMAKVTSAKMINNDFGNIKFSDLSASEV